MEVHSNENARDFNRDKPTPLLSRGPFRYSVVGDRVTLPLVIRALRPEERSMILSDWKKDLWEARPAWGQSLRSDEWWALVNHVIDRITLPSAAVWIGCHRDEPIVPLCWAAARDGAFLHMHARVSVHEQPDLAARLEQELLAHAQGRPAVFNPFLELKR